jgi:hypothetical protein
VITGDRLLRLWSYSWWILWPAFLALVLRFSYERACLDPYELLRPLMRHQSLALAVAAIYTGTHVWIVVAGVLVARTMAKVREAKIAALVTVDLKVPAMAAAIVLDQVPRAVWAWLYHALGVC